MSNAPSTLDGEQFPELPDDSAFDPLESSKAVLQSLATPFRLVGFWSSVVLPVAYVPVLAGALSGGQSTLAVLLAVHAVALVCGHGYRSD